MFTTLQAKLIALLTGVVVLLASNVGSYFYGHSNGVDSQKGKQAVVEVSRATKGMQTAVAHTVAIVAGVEIDNKKEKEANDKLDKANIELAKYRTENRRLIAERGGLFFDAPSGARCAGTTGQTEASSTSRDDGSATRTVLLPASVEQDIQDRTDEADIILERLRVLRDWARSQGFSGPDTGQPVIPDGPDVLIR